MKIRSKTALALAGLLVFAVGLAQFAIAKDDYQFVNGVVKHIDKGTKTMVVKAADGTEHTIKYTDKTTWKWHGTKEAGDSIADGSSVTVMYTEKGGEKTANHVTVTAKELGLPVSH